MNNEEQSIPEKPDFQGLFGLLKAEHGVSLEEMN